MAAYPNQHPPDNHRSVTMEVSPYDKGRARVLGTIQLFLSFTCIILESTYFAEYTFNLGCIFPVAAGLWTGLLHLGSATSTLLSANVANRCRVITSMVFSIISCLAALIGFVLAVTGAIILKSDQATSSTTTSFPNSPNTTSHTVIYYCVASQGSHVPHLLLAIAQITQFSTAMATSIFCCRGTCCGTSTVFLPQPLPSSPDASTTTTLFPAVRYTRDQPPPLPPGPRPALYRETEYSHDGYIQALGADEREEERTRENGYWTPRGDAQQYEVPNVTGEEAGSYIKMYGGNRS